MPRRTQSALTPTQLEIMNLFWEHGELRVAQVWELLTATRVVARNTVQTTLTRLVEKGWLKARVENNTYFFRSTRPRHTVLRGILSHLVDTAFAGSPTGLVMELLENRRITSEEAQRIRELLDKAQED